jgi:hypothetical protein
MADAMVAMILGMLSLSEERSADDHDGAIAFADDERDAMLDVPIEDVAVLEAPSPVSRRRRATRTPTPILTTKALQPASVQETDKPVSRITLFDGVMSTVFDGLPTSASRSL